MIDLRAFIEQHGYAPANSELGRAESRLRLTKQTREQAAQGLGCNQAPWAQRNLQTEVELAEAAVARERERAGL